MYDMCFRYSRNMHGICPEICVRYDKHVICPEEGGEGPDFQTFSQIQMYEIWL